MRRIRRPASARCSASTCASAISCACASRESGRGTATRRRDPTTRTRDEEATTDMNDITIHKPAAKSRRAVAKTVTTLSQHVVEIISDSGEGAQRCGQALGAIAARMGNGVWTVEIIPAEIRPPARSVEGASGNRIRLGPRKVTTGADETDLLVAFHEQVPLAERHH